MEVFRITAEKNSKDLTASGIANRWNLDLEFVLYTSGARSLAALEMVVNRKNIRPEILYKLMVISIPDDNDIFTQIKTKELPENWRTFDGFTELQNIGSEWYSKSESLILKVPSAVIPHEYNYVINTSHEHFKKKIKLVRTEEYFWDKRLL